MSGPPFDNELSAQVWRTKYRYRVPGADAERSIVETWLRVATAAASVETDTTEAWTQRFASLLDSFAFLPGGRILAGAGTAYETTLFNCFVMGYVDDSMGGIFASLADAAVTMQRGGGIGCDFSTLRPRGAAADTSGTIASGPVSFMRIWDAMCATLLSVGARRGAMMGTLRADHPDIIEFVDAKREPGMLTNFNLSVQVTDELMRAVDADESWPLVFPAVAGAGSAGRAGFAAGAVLAGSAGPAGAGSPARAARGDAAPELRRVFWPAAGKTVDCAVHARVPARALWQRIMDAAYDTAEPGVLFIDTINRQNNLRYRETITSTNPCGEIPLPPNGACNLGSLNLTAFVEAPFSSRARLDLVRLAAAARTAIRFLDDVIELSTFPLDAQAEEARGTRRVGLGITGLADALIMLGLRYDSDAGRDQAAEVMRTVRDAAYDASIDLAAEKGPFPYFAAEPYLDSEPVRGLPAAIRDRLARHGIRNSHLIAIAPTGTISLLANNVSSGIEPVYAAEGTRQVRNREGRFDRHEVVDYAVALWRRTARTARAVSAPSAGRPGSAGRAGHDGLPPAFVESAELSAEAHLRMQAAVQPFVDNSISKTINVAPGIDRDDFASIYRRAHALGLKGCTVFRPNEIRGSVLAPAVDAVRELCCAPDREAD